MVDFSSFRISCCTRSIAEDMNVFWRWLFKGSLWRLTSLYYTAVSVDWDLDLLSIRSQLFGDLTFHDHDVLDEARQLIFLHIDYLLCIVVLAYQSRHLCLIQNEIDLFRRHRIIKSNSCDTEMHRWEHRSCPLLSIFSPDTEESPLLTLSFDLGTQIELHHPSREVLTDSVYLLPCLPDVLTINRLAVCVVWESFTSTEEIFVGPSGHTSLEEFVKCVTVFV